MHLMETFFRTVVRFRWLVIALVLGSTVLIALPIQTLRLEGMWTPLMWTPFSRTMTRSSTIMKWSKNALASATSLWSG